MKFVIICDECIHNKECDMNQKECASWQRIDMHRDYNIF